MLYVSRHVAERRVVVGSLGESTLMLAAMDNDMVTAAACNSISSADADTTVDVRPPTDTPSNNRTLSHADNKTLPAVEAETDATVTDVQPLADDTRDVTMDVGDGEGCYF